MDALTDEILLVVFCYLDAPAALAVVSKRLYALSREPWTKAQYFLARHGRIEAFYHALGRGALLDQRTIDILLSSGAHVSRYLAQAVVQHACRKSVQFVKGPWARTLPFPVFAHFLHKVAQLYPNVDISKGEDDGSVFLRWIQQYKFSNIIFKHVPSDRIIDMFDNGFIPFSPKDPVHVQMPLAIALEPRLLPLARRNGLGMDSKYRDFILRKVFEKPSTERDQRAQEIVDKVRALTELDDSMFVKRTVAAEVCMEACSNEPAYSALKKLDRRDELRFNLSDVVSDLLSLFVRTRSVTQPSTISVLHKLYQDFPAPRHPAVRLVMLLTIFCSTLSVGTSAATLKARLGAFNLLPLTRTDVVRVLSNPFLEKPGALLKFARIAVPGFKDDEPEVVHEVVQACLVNSCKGKLLKTLYELYPEVKEQVSSAFLSARIKLDDLPAWNDEDGGARAKAYRASFCAGFGTTRSDYDMYDLFGSGLPEAEDLDEQEEENVGSARSAEAPATAGKGDVKMETDSDTDEAATLPGTPSMVLQAHGGSPPRQSPVAAYDEEDEDPSEITQESLSSRISADEASFSNGSRRRWWSRSYSVNDSPSNKQSWPNDALEVGRWVRDQYGPLHPTTAVCLTHAIINGNYDLVANLTFPAGVVVPVTLEHFRMLARLGRSPMPFLWGRLEDNIKFYYSANDYLDPTVPKPEPPSNDTITVACALGKRKRPARAVGRAAPSYAESDSDDANDDRTCAPRHAAVTTRHASHLETWIHHLTLLQREEEAKWKQKRRLAEHDENGKLKQRVEKTEFLKTLTWRLKELRGVLADRSADAHVTVAGTACAVADDDDDEFVPGRRKHARLV
ncbi:hypothetical protein EXIGLDRAFT_683841 [Exidia glandulosa HHB12029]|uniref:F-box domain-containing protein n=1 Tax=Exidia glandulosa HHB12029 TaxID=1314781 RepID=A0A165CYL2_EXIGL|nr:hypothetical protein EXIGLDRAFT_683841 [Exidia glandulosa HHB12029]